MNVTKEKAKNGESTYHITCDILAIAAGVAVGTYIGVELGSAIMKNCGKSIATRAIGATISGVTGLSCGFNIYESIRILKMMDEEKKMKKKEKEDIDDGSHITID